MTKKKPKELLQKRGRKPKISNVEVLQAKIDEYFNNCPDKVILSCFDKNNGEWVEYDKKTPTISGLALYLGFCSRSAFYEYENKPEFQDTIKKARFRLENEYEKQLYNDKCTGAIFALKNLGWKDKIENEITANETTQEAFLKHLKDLGNNAD